MPIFIHLYQSVVLLILITFSTHTYASNQAIILQYHHVSDTTPAITSISPELFKWHLNYLEQENFVIWPLSKITQYLNTNKALPDKCVAITFDDAYQSIYTTAFPLLKQRNWPFTLFLNTDAVGKGNNSLNWSQIREMNNSIAEIGNHSHTHAHLIREKNNELAHQWKQRIIGEIETAQKIIDQNLSHSNTPPPRLFAYPYGEYSIPLTQIIKELGYTAVGQQSGPAESMTPKEILPRFPMGGIYTSKNQLIEKLKTYALPLATNEIIEPVINPKTKPVLILKIKPEYWNKNLKKQFQCYVSGQGKAQIHWEQQTAYIQAKKKTDVGRSRYNCTAPVSKSVNGQIRHGFYWYSQLWITPKANGEWYKE